MTEKKKKGFFSSLFAPKKSCCCNIQFEEVPVEKESGANDNDVKDTQECNCCSDKEKSSGNTENCC